MFTNLLSQPVSSSSSVLTVPEHPTEKEKKHCSNPVCLRLDPGGAEVLVFCYTAGTSTKARIWSALTNAWREAPAMEGKSGRWESYAGKDILG